KDLIILFGMSVFGFVFFLYGITGKDLVNKFQKIIRPVANSSESEEERKKDIDVSQEVKRLIRAKTSGIIAVVLLIISFLCFVIALRFTGADSQVMGLAKISILFFGLSLAFFL